LTSEDAVQAALQANPQVRAARAQYEAALRQVAPAYTPQDPQLSLSNSQTPNGFKYAQTRSIGLTENLQFPGKAWLQGGQARRSAEIARLAYAAAQRDARAQAKTAYYQTLLDGALAQTAAENAANLERVMKVAQVAYAANQVTQSDVISSQFDLSQASQSYRSSQIAEANDEAALDLVLGRPAREPLKLAPDLELAPLTVSLDEVVDKAQGLRQELLEAALTEKNAESARKLAWMELLPDFSANWTWNHYPPGSINAVNPAAPASDYSTSLAFNVPVFFWFRQKEDIRAADRLLEAARENRRFAELQTETSIVQLYRSTKLAYDTAILYRDALVPLAQRNFQVALVAYQSRKVDFPTLVGTLQRIYNARVSYLTAANQFLAGRVALEQAIGMVSSL
jgi:cobalt-zinc-cadmium efflux system outer membrane protein